jgi:hypothetical protein
VTKRIEEASLLCVPATRCFEAGLPDPRALPESSLAPSALPQGTLSHTVSYVGCPSTVTPQAVLCEQKNQPVPLASLGKRPHRYRHWRAGGAAQRQSTRLASQGPVLIPCTACQVTAFLLHRQALQARPGGERRLVFDSLLKKMN